VGILRGVADEHLTEHYGSGYEQQRLREGEGRLEWLRTMELIERFAPAPPGRVLDVGGGPGAYAHPLARLGYEVHLIDPVPLHVEQARAGSGLASAEVGDARNLGQADVSFDVVLALGPLYHLTVAEDRHAALSEAHRVLRPGGRLFAAAISRFASTCDGLRLGYLREPEFESIVVADLEHGQHRNETTRPEWFTTAFFHHPDELADEVTRAGFELDAVLAVEGPAWLVPLADWLGYPDATASLLRAIRRIEAEPSLLGVSAHLIAVARKR
jgi:SAM-dependent methyltransferase